MYESYHDYLKALFSSGDPLFIRETYVKKLYEYAQTKLVVTVLGQRRTGKSYIILSMIKELNISLDKVFYFNKENDFQDTIKNIKDLTGLFDDFVSKKGEPEYLIIDEIQEIDGRETFIRAKYASKKYKIIISGSNSKLLSGELATHLTGRHIQLQVYPFSYDEILLFDKKFPLNTSVFDFYEYLGGLPQVLFLKNTTTSISFLKTTIESIVSTDIVKRYRIRDIKLIIQILNYMANTLGSILSIKNIIDYCKAHGNKTISSHTVSNYIEYLKHAYIINEVQRYDIQGKKVFENKNKYYFTDLGIRNTFGYNAVNDRGKLLENMVFLHMKSLGYELYVGEMRDKEIDFVAIRGNDKVYIQVALTIHTDEVRDREFGNLLKINDAYRKIVVSTDIGRLNNYEGVERWHIEKFLETYL